MPKRSTRLQVRAPKANATLEPAGPVVASDVTALNSARSAALLLLGLVQVVRSARDRATTHMVLDFLQRCPLAGGVDRIADWEPRFPKWIRAESELAKAVEDASRTVAVVRDYLPTARDNTAGRFAAATAHDLVIKLGEHELGVVNVALRLAVGGDSPTEPNNVASTLAFLEALTKLPEEVPQVSLLEWNRLPILIDFEYQQAVKSIRSTAEDDTPANCLIENSTGDFRGVRWGKISFSFTPNQAVIVGILFDAWQRGCHDVGDQTLLEKAEAGTRLDHVFRCGDKRPHEAWGTMIVRGKTKGTRRLADPP